MDIFAKCYSYFDTKFVKQMGLYPYFKVIGSSGGSRVNIGGREIIMTGSNNYLGLTHHPEVVEVARKSIEKYGTGCTGSRLLNGNLELHEKIERSLAKFLGKEEALVFSTGFTANQGTIEAICGKGDLILSDNENHASIISGCSISKAEVKRYDHRNLEGLSAILDETDNISGGRFLVTDGVFSMTGGIVPIDKIIELTEGRDVRVMVDDAHAIGVIGKNGRGTASHFNLTDSVDIIMGTFSKSLSSIGGFIAAESDVIEFIKHRSRSFIFSAAIPPASAATVIKCLEIMEKEPEIIKRLWDNTAFMQKGLERLGVDYLGSTTPINPILVKDDVNSFKIAAELFEMGVYVTPIVYPAVPRGQSLIRTSVMATHTEEDLNFAINAFEKMVKKYKIDFKHQEASQKRDRLLNKKGYRQPEAAL